MRFLTQYWLDGQVETETELEKDFSLKTECVSEQVATGLGDLTSFIIRLLKPLLSPF
jgi:hypothetical protein